MADGQIIQSRVVTDKDSSAILKIAEAVVSVNENISAKSDNGKPNRSFIKNKSKQFSRDTPLSFNGRTESKR